ncbi:MAG: hypothetical protein GXY33_04985 [Phycisphaerae bacterium]|nr:hypothetical protein [Phycisphaerae bacterium]
MAALSVPLAKPKPDIERMVAVIMGERPADPPPLVEYIIDDVHLEALTRRLGRTWVPPADPGLIKDGRSAEAYLDNFIECWYRLGYDYVRIERGAGFTVASETAEDETRQDQHRGWVDTERGLISSWEDFERYPWPTVTDEKLADIAYVNDHLPEGMGLISSHAANQYEHLSFIMGYENLCIQLYEQPDLVQAVADRIGGILEEFYQRLVQFENLAVVWPGDDMGFKTATLVRPEQLRQYVLPHHKRFAEIAHGAGKPYFLHSCGHVFSVMEDLIEDVKIDAKHSFENAILPVAEFQKRYGDRIGVLGGVDVDVLTARSADEIRKETRRLIDTCGPRGRYAIGSGNSIPSYVPLDHYLTMLDEALKR